VNNKLKDIPFTPFQLGLTLMNSIGLIFCIGGDVFMMMYDRGTVSKGLVVANLVMAVITLIMCGALVFRAGEIDLWNHDDDGDKRPAVIALRTYLCMVAADLTGVLMLMLFGALVWNGAMRAIMIYAPLMFIAAGAVYFWRTSRMGAQQDELTEEDSERQELMKAVDAIIAEEHSPRTAESILAEIKADIEIDNITDE
jgi:hypothetical protein